MNLGKAIKRMRTEKALSQSELAEVFNVTAQAISKWESNSSYPDISQLPAIASYFGITIDELFEYPTDLEYTRIEHAVENGYPLTNEFFNHSETFLIDQLKRNPDNYKANSILGDLYHFEACCLNEKAAHYALKALKIKPDNKFDLNTLNNASNGMINDWNVNNHSKLVNILKTLMNEQQNQRTALFLIDNLIADGRLNEAKKLLEEGRGSYLSSYYEILIQEKKSGFNNTKKLYMNLMEDNKNDWRILMEIANRFASNCQYEVAIEIYELCHDIAPKPRYTDMLDAIVKLYEILGENEKVIQTYQRELNLLKEEWNITKGKQVKEIQDRIDKYGFTIENK